MKKLPQKNKVVCLYSILFFAMGFMCSGYAMEIEQEDGIDLPIRFAVMTPDRNLSFTAESDTLPNPMIIYLVVIGTGERNILRATFRKTDTTGEVIAVMFNRGPSLSTHSGAPDSQFNIGVTPRTISVDPTFWWTGTAVISTAILFSLEEGPFSYTVTVSLGAF